MDKYNIRSIGYFLKLADTLNFSQAAEELYITQSTLSKHIKQFEEEIGVTLFYRNTKNVVLTPGGKLCYDEWKTWLDRSDSLLHDARALNGFGASKIRIGIIEFGGTMEKIIAAIETYNEAHEELDIDFEILGYSDLRKMLDNGDLDLIITLSSEVGEHRSTIHVRQLMSLPLYIIVPQKNHLYTRESLDSSELAEETFCVFSDSYSNEAKNNILNHCKACGFTPKNIKYFSNIKSLVMSLEHSDYITIGYDAFFENNDRVKLFPTPNMGGVPEMVFAWKGDLRKSTTDFLNYLQKELQ